LFDADAHVLAEAKASRHRFRRAQVIREGALGGRC
jgi:hypothetical protein